MNAHAITFDCPLITKRRLREHRFILFMSTWVDAHLTFITEIENSLTFDIAKEDGDIRWDVPVLVLFMCCVYLKRRTTCDSIQSTVAILL